MNQSAPELAAKLASKVRMMGNLLISSGRRGVQPESYIAASVLRKDKNRELTETVVEICKILSAIESRHLTMSKELDSRSYTSYVSARSGLVKSLSSDLGSQDNNFANLRKVVANLYPEKASAVYPDGCIHDKLPKTARLAY